MGVGQGLRLLGLDVWGLGVRDIERPPFVLLDQPLGSGWLNPESPIPFN